ncbi:MAG: ABC transporter ATP-binding protein [Negativicutes bacterium]|nr:ABC transporter ATP-binding protein [Negativicutes bacterium]
MNELLLAKSLSKAYGNIEAVRKVDFTLKAGEFIALLGSSGSGKSTLLALLAGLETATSGEAYLADRLLNDIGEDELSLLRRQNMGIVFQSFNLIPTLNALENVAFPLFPVPMPYEEKRQKAMALIERVGLAHRINNRPGELSGGEKQRVAIARALINSPKVVLADEPTGNLDSTTGQEVINLLVSLSKEQGVALLVATHDEKLAQAAERIIYMKDGEIVDHV